jgi:Holliday junction resolvase RusA-like endonuclease
MMIASFTIPGRLPGQNEMISSAKGFGGRGFGYSKLKKKWTDDISLLARSSRLPRFGRVRLTFDWHEPQPSRTCRRRDPDNVAAGKKLVLDGLVAAGVLANDNSDVIAGWTDTFSVGGVIGVRVTLEEVK